MKRHISLISALAVLGTVPLLGLELPPDNPPPASLVLWMDAQNADGQNNATLVNGASVTSWKDNSSFDRPTGPINAGPTFTANGLFGKPAVRFAATNFLFGNGPISPNFPLTVFAIFATKASGQGAVFGLGDSASPEFNEIWVGSSNTVAAVHRRADPAQPAASTNVVTDGLPHTVVVRFLSASNVMLYVDGKLARVDATSRNYTPQNYDIFTIGGVDDGTSDTVPFQGDISEVRAYSVDFGDDDRRQIEQRLFKKWIQRLPSITQQPQATNVLAGATATFTVAASNPGVAPLAYQWLRDGRSLAKATNAVLSVVNAVTADQGLYSVEVSNPDGTVTSAAVQLTVTVPAQAPTILAQPRSQSLPQGTNLTLSVSALGAEVLSYQWRKNGANVSGANSAVLEYSNIGVELAGMYDVRVANSIGSITSSVANVQISTAAVPPRIVTAPNSLTTTRGSVATLSVTAAGTLPLSYQWFKNGTAISGGTSATLTFGSVTLADQGSYSVVVSNVASTATIIPVTVTVKEPASGANTWTLLVYGHGDNNLSSSLVGDMIEMERAGSSAGFNIVVQADFNAKENHYGQLPAGTEIGVSRYLIQKGNNPDQLTSTPVQRLPELNMDDPSVLTDFIRWGVTNYPANHYGVILWNHGGQYAGFGGDTQDGTGHNSAVRTASLRASVQSALSATTVSKLDFFAFDTCLMGGAEVLGDFRDLTDTYIACPEIDFGPGWDYDATFNYLKANPGVPMRDFATQEVGYWKAHHFSNPNDAKLGAHAAYDLTRYAAFQSAWFTFGAALNDFAKANPIKLAAIRRGTTPYSNTDPLKASSTTDLTDLGELAAAVAAASESSANLKSLCNNLIATIKNMVITSVAGTLKSRTTGLSVYYPAEGITDGGYQTLNVSKEAGYSWETFLFTVVANFEANSTPPQVAAGTGGKSVAVNRTTPVRMSLDLDNQTDIARITAQLVSYELTGDPADAVYLGEVYSSNEQPVSIDGFEYDGTVLKIQGADSDSSFYLGGFFDPQDITIVNSYALYLPPDGEDSQLVILQTDLSGTAPTILGALDGEPPEGDAARGIELRPGGELTPVYLVASQIEGEEDPVYDWILADASIIVPAEGLDGVDVYWDYLPIGSYIVSVFTEDFFGNVSDPLDFDVTVEAASAEVVAGPVGEAGELVVWYAGTPGQTYTIEATDGLSSGLWEKVTNLTAPDTDEGNGSGVFEFREPLNVSRNRFYRSVWPAY